MIADASVSPRRRSVIWCASSFARLASVLALVTMIAPAVATMSAGIWLTRPSPTVRIE